MNDELIKEAEEDLRQERLMAFWNQWKYLFIGGISLLVLGTAGVSFHGEWTKSQNEKATDQFVNALENVESNQLNALNDIDVNTKRHQAILNLLKTGQYIQNDNMDDAIRSLANVINNGSADPLLRDLSRVNKAAILISQKDTDFETVQKTLNPVLKDKKNPFQNYARLYLSVAQANIQNDFEQSLETIDSILNAPSVSQTIRQLATELRTVYANNHEKS